MITLFTGMPGAGKTASMVDFLSKLPGDRPIYVDGLNGLKIPHTVCDATKWNTDLPDGAILVVDEVQRVWRPRGAGAKVPDSVAALETHRHRGIDVFVTTQAPRLMDANVRGLVGRHVHIRDTGILGRYWYEWPECNDSMIWKTCINKKRITLPKKSFDLYTSASIHTVPVRGVPPALIFGLLALLLFFGLAFGAYKIMTRAENQQSTKTVKNEVVTAEGSAVVAKKLNLPFFPSSADAQVTAGFEAAPYDSSQFLPRVLSRPESAPAYDQLRVVAVMPVVSGAICIKGVCRCLTQQGTDTGMTSEACRTWSNERPFNPYSSPSSAVVAAVVQPVQSAETKPDLSVGYSPTFPPVKSRLY